MKILITLLSLSAVILLGFMSYVNYEQKRTEEMSRVISQSIEHKPHLKSEKFN